MRQIYQSASSVVVWLGDDDGDGGTAIELLSQISHKIRNIREDREIPSNFLVHEFSESAPWYSLAFFFSSPWFQRSWVVQECVASAMSGNGLLMFYYGRSCISWADLKDLGLRESIVPAEISVLVEETWESHPRHYPSAGDILGANFNHLRGPRACPVRRDIVKTFKAGFREWLKLSKCLTPASVRERSIASHKLLFWLMRIRNRQATNPSDKIYSVLGLVLALHGQEEPEDVATKGVDALIVDYKASVEDVYSSLVRAVVTKTKSLHILGACSRRGPLIQRSWTPDWTQNREDDLPAIELSHGDITARPGSGITGFDAASGRECNVVFAHDLSILSAEGIFWDTLSLKTTTVHRNDPAVNYRVAKGGLPDLFAKELLDIWDHSTRRNVYTDDLCNTALWHTLLIRYSFMFNQRQLFRNCPPSMFWVPQFRYDLATNNPTDTLPSALEAVSRLTRTSLNSPEDTIQTLHSAIISLISWEGAVFATEKGYIGEGTDRCQVGDIICVLLGCNYPVILRPDRPFAGHYKFVGEVYVYGIMHGEVIRALEERKVQSRWFEIC
jgi:hypothetical protein